ncbi:LCP family protein [Rossellomorea arthrocnemi]|jgi:polyisoprenyl-teichoic acid--peptidoglycan teichoic acid transferase|uniref:LCP family protein n=1 Tax=Rossellomorea arthrocnemi TaxID=2769542 RepID=UPI0019194B7E|nr:LCP family protein [Rossellomorea arthrocnemi]
MSIERSHVNMIKKKKRRRRIVFFLIIPLLIVTFSVAGYGAMLYKKAETAFNGSFKDIQGREKSQLRTEKVDPKIDNVSILFIGVDESDTRNFGSATRSDALMLATLNEKEKSVKLVSIPRDSYVYLPEVGYKTKINHAHAYGGPKASIEAVETMFNIPVDYYVKMNFHAFIDVVDALDGINVEVPYEMYEQNSKDTANAVHLLPGMQSLDGEEALALARTRKKDNDIERGKRQQEILKGVMQKAISANALTKYDDIIQAIGDNMETNMTFDEMKALSSYGLKKKLDMNTLSLEGEDTYIENVYYWLLDETSLANTSIELQDHLEIDPTTAGESDYSEQSVEDSDSYE